MFDMRVMKSMYAKAESAEDLPWHQSDPPKLLMDALESRPRCGRALDLGCGAGTFAVYLAKRGFEVTAIDIIPRALDLAAKRAQQEKVTIDFVVGDLLAWQAPAPFDLVLDSGCLHSLVGGSSSVYKRRLVSWLAPGADYVLGHWGKRHALDWRPIGPRRRSRSELASLFAPELFEHAHHEEQMRGIPMPFGPTVLGVGIWFKRASF